MDERVLPALGTVANYYAINRENHEPMPR